MKNQNTFCEDCKFHPKEKDPCDSSLCPIFSNPKFNIHAPYDFHELTTNQKTLLKNPVYRSNTKTMQLILTIEIGNDAMLTGSDVSQALKQVAGKIEGHTAEYLPDFASKILDANGNSVGKVEIK